MKIRLLSVALLACLLTPWCGYSAELVVEVQPSKQIDERLFLMRLLERLHNDFPANASDPATFQNELGALRHRVNRLHEYLKERKLDDRITSLYADYLEVIDGYVEFLADIGKIERQAVARAEKEAAESGFQAGFRGGAAAAAVMNHPDATGSDALVGGLIVGAIDYFWSEYNKGQRREAAKQEVIDAAVRRLERKVSTALARAENAALTLTDKYGWAKGEAGFDTGAEHDRRIQRLIEADDLNGLVKLTAQIRSRRPRDPFAAATSCFVESFKPDTFAAKASLAQQCVEAAALIPEGRMYDEYRADLLAVSGWIASRAAAEERGGNGWAKARSETAAYAIAVWDACLRYTSDPTGEVREERAWALAWSGQPEKALKQALEVKSLRQGSLDYCYNMARLLSILGETSVSFDWLAHAVRTFGITGIATLRKDPDLEAVRKEQKEKFEDLIKVKSEWRIEFGFFADDITLTNRSAFPLTNVALEVRVESGGRTWTPQLKADVVKPGETYRWGSALSGTGGKADRATARLWCDQNR